MTNSPKMNVNLQNIGSLEQPSVAQWQNKKSFFVAGGTLSPKIPSYVKRPADDMLFASVMAGEYCYVLTARQMGKSSLMVRTASRLTDAGLHTVILDLTEIGTTGTIDNWYLDILTEIADQLILSVEPEPWWNARASLGYIRRFTNFLRDIVLTEINTSIAIFIDEIDTTLSIDFADDFFASLRACYNARSRNPVFERLTFILIGAATPSDLIQDPTRTPFNIGRAIDLQEFDSVDAEVLQMGFKEFPSAARHNILERIFWWTNGHPYLTQKLCLAITDSIDKIWTDEKIDELVIEKFLMREARKESNLQFIQNRIDASPNRQQLMELYSRIWQGDRIVEDIRSSEQNKLKLIGLVRVKQGSLIVRNEIYHRVFDIKWVHDNPISTSHLSVSLLGQPIIELNGMPLTGIASNKSQALLYYIIATGRPHSRQALATLLWSDLSEEEARRNLRVELTRLKTIFEPYLVIERDSLAFNPNAPYTLDIAHFEANLRDPEPSSQELQEAIALYQGDFLENFYVRDAPPFEEWAVNTREHLRQTLQRAILRLAVRCLQEKQYKAGIDFIDRLLALVPWLEEAHQIKMELLARNGQRGAVLQQYELCCNVLDQEYGVPPSDETNAIYDKIMAGEIGLEAEESAEPTFTLPSVALPPPFQVPTPITHFVGRSDDLATLEAALVAKKGPRVHALIGMGGIGKSALATHIAHALREHFVDGVLWASVANSDPLDILGHWAQAYGYNFRGLSDVETRATALRGVLADKRTLIIVDDVRSVRRTLPLLVGGPQCAMLLTTRDLDVATALNAQPHSVGELAPQEGIHLLTQILGEARVTAEPEAAAEICALLQHLPLAVELTAQRLVSRPRRRLIDMATRLRDVKERLDLAISDRAVRTSFTVSWEALDTNLRHIFALLAVFAGRSFAAPALAHIAGLDVYTTEDRLFALGALSLVGEVEGNRYRQHPLLADFAREQLGEGSEAYKAMAVYYQMFAQQHRTNYLALQPEWENMMAGMRVAHAQQAWPLVLTYTATLTEAWFVRAHYTQARQAYALARDAALVLMDEQVLATCLLKWGQACIEQTDYAEAEALLADSMHIFKRAEDAAGIASVQYHLARIAVEQAQYDVAERLLVSSQQIREQLGDEIGVSATIYQQASLCYYRREFYIARSLCERALAKQEGMNDKLGALRTLRLLADITLEQLDYDSANIYCERALALCGELQDQGELAATYYSLAVINRRKEKLDIAQTYVDKAHELSRWIGNRRLQASTLYELGNIYAQRNDYSQAVQVLLQSLVLFREIQDTFSLVYALYYLGKFYAQLSKLQQTHTVWLEALDIAKAQHHPLTEQLYQNLHEI